MQNQDFRDLREEDWRGPRRPRRALERRAASSMASANSSGMKSDQSREEIANDADIMLRALMSGLRTALLTEVAWRSVSSRSASAHVVGGVPTSGSNATAATHEVTAGHAVESVPGGSTLAQLMAVYDTDDSDCQGGTTGGVPGVEPSAACTSLAQRDNELEAHGRKVPVTQAFVDAPASLSHSTSSPGARPISVQPGASTQPCASTQPGASTQPLARTAVGLVATTDGGGATADASRDSVPSHAVDTPHGERKIAAVGYDAGERGELNGELRHAPPPGPDEERSHEATRTPVASGKDADPSDRGARWSLSPRREQIEGEREEAEDARHRHSRHQDRHSRESHSDGRITHRWRDDRWRDEWQRDEWQRDEWQRDDGGRNDRRRRKDQHRDHGRRDDRRHDEQRRDDRRRDERRRDEGRRGEGRRDDRRRDDRRRDDRRRDYGRRDERRRDDGRRQKERRREERDLLQLQRSRSRSRSLSRSRSRSNPPSSASYS